MDGTLLTAVRPFYRLLTCGLQSLMLDGVEAHMLLFAETQIYRYLQQEYTTIYLPP